MGKLTGTKKNPVYINNLWVEMTRAELVKFLNDRSAYYAAKGKVAEEKLKRLKDVDREVKAAQDEEDEDNPAHTGKNFSNRMEYRPEDDLRERLKDCRDKEKAFKFMAEHLVPHSIYRLSESDMIKLGLMKQYY
jgi:hypothetical protein